MWCLIFVHFRLDNLTYIYIAPKIALVHGYKLFANKFGEQYASKEILYSRHRGFMIPKASPLEASYDSLLCKGYIFIQIH